MTANLQQLAEGLADRLERSVAIDNKHVQLLAHSPHRGEVDPARAESILRRAVPQEIVKHVYDCKDEATGLYKVTPRQDLGLVDSRIGYPIIYQGTLFGFLWLLSVEGPVSEEHDDQARRAATEAALLMHREYLQVGLDRGRERELLELLVSDSEDQRQSAAVEIGKENLFVPRNFAVIVAEIEHKGPELTQEDQLALASGLAAVRSKCPSRHVLTLEQRDHVLLILADSGKTDARANLLSVGESLREAVLNKSDAKQCWIGIGRSRNDLAAAWRSYHEALRAARTSRRVKILEPVTAVERLGVYELLAQVPEETLSSMLHPGLRTLMEQRPRTDSLIHTLEVFLDNAGNVKATAEQLFAHRTSLYYRLHRIQELTGLDLSDGDDRLVAHLGLKILRLSTAQ
ncbi:PucR family transcriptional regulator [Nesterenkonia ebinurensis]|uniref:PucR family transcriptional regulator n=1 Tax=Nesterenkonia ebinurensis TaxID=2608252 RepID=UPI00123D6406|nr:helix-turn-helix domain-containing protein [Nesterenkonia ebinurensis]